MFDHVTIRVSERRAAEEFYGLLLSTLGIEQTSNGVHFAEWDDFSLTQADEADPVTRRLHIGFVAPSREHVDEFWRVGTDAGYREDGTPGPRPQYGDDYYGAFLLDFDGNSVEAVHHGNLREGGVVDHLWIRVRDVQASKEFYEAIAPHGGFRLRRELTDPARAQFAGSSGSFSIVAGTPTEHLHLAFPGPDDETVQAFHRAAIEAGYQDNGLPRERPIYHEGYYGAYVLDPDGNNIEVVNHNH